MKKTLFYFVLSFFIFSCNTAKSIKTDNSPINDTLTKDLQATFEKGPVVGFSVSVLNEQKVLYENGFGFTDIELSKPYTSNTTQNIASISKTLIGIALLKAQELGKLNLNDPINKYLPYEIKNPDYPGVPILIKHLAYHSSSIVDEDEIYAKAYVLEASNHKKNEAVFSWFQKPEDRITLSEFLENCLSANGK